MDIQFFNFIKHGDARGQLVAIEELKDIPFSIKRVYYMWDAGPEVRRGYHAHKKLQQVLICVRGRCKILLDDGTEKQVVLMDDPSKGLYVSNVMWREMYDFSSDAVLMVLASEYYDPSDYIRDYDEFLKFVGKEKK